MGKDTAPVEQSTTDQHVYHHYDNDGARVNVSFERNSRGVNYSATVVGARTVAEAMLLLHEAEQALKGSFADSETPAKKE